MSAVTAREVRDWLAAQGAPVAPTGGLNMTLIKRWNEAHPDRPHRLPAEQVYTPHPPDRDKYYNRQRHGDSDW